MAVVIRIIEKPKGFWTVENKHEGVTNGPFDNLALAIVQANSAAVALRDKLATWQSEEVDVQILDSKGHQSMIWSFLVAAPPADKGYDPMTGESYPGGHPEPVPEAEQ